MVLLFGIHYLNHFLTNIFWFVTHVFGRCLQPWLRIRVELIRIRILLDKTRFFRNKSQFKVRYDNHIRTVRNFEFQSGSDHFQNTDPDPIVFLNIDPNLSKTFVSGSPTLLREAAKKSFTSGPTNKLTGGGGWD